MTDKILTDDEIKAFDLHGKNHLLMIFANQVIHNHPDIAASILLVLIKYLICIIP
jgi:hypothetical protein